MANIFFISDTHFFHKNILTFKNQDGTYLRPEFVPLHQDDNSLRDATTAMNEKMIENWNSVVKSDSDKVYHLGDVTMHNGPEFDNLMRRLNGKKRLIPGNHDVLKIHGLMKHFQKVSIWRVFREFDFTLTHIPLHDTSLKTNFNVHGHTHCAKVPDEKFVNVCVENWNYTPIHLDNINAEIKKRKEVLGI